MFISISGHFSAPVPKVAFFVGLAKNKGPIEKNMDIVFDKIVTNYGGGYDNVTGRFTAPFSGIYSFTVVVAAQGRQKVNYYFESVRKINLSHVMRKPDFCIAKTKAQISCAVTAQLISAFVFATYRTTDLRLCFRYTDSTIHLLFKSETISSL